MEVREGLSLSITEFNSTFRRLSRHHEGIYGNQREMIIQVQIAMNLEYHEFVVAQRHASNKEMIEMALRIE